MDDLPVEESLISIPLASVHLIDKKSSVELAFGEFSVVRLRQGDQIIAILARVSDDLQWPIIEEVSIVKVDDLRYFFSIADSSSKKKGGDVLNYELSFALKEQKGKLSELDKLFESFGNFTVQYVSDKVVWEAVAREMSTEERNCGAYWTALAPDVEEYSSTTAKIIASGSGQLVKGILWSGDVTVNGLKWGQQLLIRHIHRSENKEIDSKTLNRISRAKTLTKMTKKAATGVLIGVVKVSGLVMSAVANSKMRKRFYSILPGEMMLASLDGFDRICDAVEVAGKEVMSTTSTVTTGIVTRKYGENAGKATQEVLGAAGHAIGTVWTFSKLRKALNPKNVLKPTNLAKHAIKAAADDYKNKKTSKSKKNE